MLVAFAVGALLLVSLASIITGSMAVTRKANRSLIAYNAAAAALERSLQVDPGQAEPAKILSLVYGKRGVDRSLAGNPAGALADLEAAVKLDPKASAARLNLAALLAEKGDLLRAREEAGEALRLQPGYEKAEALLRALPRK